MGFDNTLSYSSMDKFVDCPRKWYFHKVLNEVYPPTESTILGNKVHTFLESYITTRKLGDDPLLAAIVEPGLQYIRDVDYVELSLGDYLIDVDGLHIVGFVDMLTVTDDAVIIGDHKTLSNLRYAHTEDSLKLHNQMLLYAYVLGKAHKAYLNKQLIFKHIYYRTDTGLPPFSMCVETKSSWRKVMEFGEGLLPQVARAMQFTAKKSLEDVQGVKGACKKYGGCPYKDRCPKVSILQDNKFLQEGENMFMPPETKVQEDVFVEKLIKKFHFWKDTYNKEITADLVASTINVEGAKAYTLAEGLDLLKQRGYVVNAFGVLAFPKVGTVTEPDISQVLSKIQVFERKGQNVNVKMLEVFAKNAGFSDIAHVTKELLALGYNVVGDNLVKITDVIEGSSEALSSADVVETHLDPTDPPVTPTEAVEGATDNVDVDTGDVEPVVNTVEEVGVKAKRGRPRKYPIIVKEDVVSTPNNVFANVEKLIEDLKSMIATMKPKENTGLFLYVDCLPIGEQVVTFESLISKYIIAYETAKRIYYRVAPYNQGVHEVFSAFKTNNDVWPAYVSISSDSPFYQGAVELFTAENYVVVRSLG